MVTSLVTSPVFSPTTRPSTVRLTANGVGRIVNTSSSSTSLPYRSALRSAGTIATNWFNTLSARASSSAEPRRLTSSSIAASAFLASRLSSDALSSRAGWRKTASLASSWTVEPVSGTSSSSRAATVGSDDGSVNKEARASEGDAIAGRESALGDGDAVDRGAVVALVVDDAVAVLGLLDVAVMARDVLCLEHDIVVGLAADGGDVGVEIENSASGGARERDQLGPFECRHGIGTRRESSSSQWSTTWIRLAAAYCSLRIITKLRPSGLTS